MSDFKRIPDCGHTDPEDWDDDEGDTILCRPCFVKMMNECYGSNKTSEQYTEEAGHSDLKEILRIKDGENW